MKYRILLHLEGMKGRPSEICVNNTIRNIFDVRHVHSFASMQALEIICSHVISEQDLKDVLEPAGFRIVGYTCQKQKKNPSHIMAPHPLKKIVFKLHPFKAV